MGTVITPIGQALISAYDSNATDTKGCPITTGTLNANILLSSCIAVSIILQFFIREDLRRQKAEKESLKENQNAADENDEL